MKDIVFDPYPDVTYYGVFVFPEESPTVQELFDFVYDQLQEETSLYIYPCDPFHITLAHRQARGSPALHQWIDENMNKEVELKTRKIVYNNKIAVILCQGNFETCRGRENEDKHITVKMAHGVKQTEAFNLLKDPNKREVLIPEGLSMIKGRVDAWNFS